MYIYTIKLKLDLSAALEQMHSISLAMSGSLETQQATIKRLDRKSEVIHNSMISLSGSDVFVFAAACDIKYYMLFSISSFLF